MSKFGQEISILNICFSNHFFDVPSWVRGQRLFFFCPALLIEKKRKRGRRNIHTNRQTHKQKERKMLSGYVSEVEILL
jgi:hypothetical protein